MIARSSARFGTLAAAVLAALAAPTTASAQAAACEIDEGSPRQVQFAALALARAAQAQNAADRQKALKDVFKQLDAVKPTENPLGVAWQYGQASILWLQDEGAPAQVKRGDLGFKADAAGTLDLLVFADEQLSKVEAAKPECREMLQQWRSQGAWFRNIQAAFNAIGNDDVAAAEAAVDRSLIINRANAYGPYVKANLAQRKLMATADMGERAAWTDSSLRWLEATIKFAGSDTSYAEIKERSLLDVVRIRSDQFDTQLAMSDTKAACAGSAAPAAAAAVAFLGEHGTSPEATNVRSTIANLHLTCGDTAAAVAVYDPVLAAPATYGDLEAVQAGVLMTRINDNAKAVRAFEAALAANPYQRDALNNLAATYFNAGKFAEMIPVIDTLVKVDPTNPDNWLWYAYAYQGRAKGVKATDPRQKQFNDSLVYYNRMSEEMPLKVTFSKFLRGDETILGGQLEWREIAPAAPARRPAAGRAAAPKPAPAAEKAFTMTVHFIDLKGNVLDTQTTQVGPLKPGGTAEWEVKSTTKGVTGFRYDKLQP